MKRLLAIISVCILFAFVTACQPITGQDAATPTPSPTPFGIGSPIGEGNELVPEKLSVTMGQAVAMEPIYTAVIQALSHGEYNADDSEFIWNAVYSVLADYGYGVTVNYSTHPVYSPQKSLRTQAPDATPTAKSEDITDAEISVIISAMFGEAKDIPDLPDGFEGITKADGKYSIQPRSASNFFVKINEPDNSIGSRSCSVKAVLYDDNNEPQASYIVRMTINPNSRSPYPLAIVSVEEIDAEQ